MTKTQATNAIKSLGYTVHFDTGSCGDGDHGSRLYFRHPDAPLNQWGQPTDLHGTISKTGCKWSVSDFKR